ncbi:MAG: putative Ig domain-containing protein [Candidatus Binatia bacterium]
MSLARRLRLLLVLPVLMLARPAAACVGDCNLDGQVAVNELVQGVFIALGGAVAVCQPFDADGNGAVEIPELIAAVQAALDGLCPPDATATPSIGASPTSSLPPTATALPSDTPTPTPSPTVTAAPNLPPLLPDGFVYRTHPGEPVALPIAATDPEGGALRCRSEGALPAGAGLDEERGLLDWTPSAEQVGSYVVPIACSDDAIPPAAVSGTLALRVTPLDPCSVPSCDAATGCRDALAPLPPNCCAGVAPLRLAEPAVGCPQGRVLFLGTVSGLDTFGRLQNCDTLRIVNRAQSSAEIRFHLRARCLNTLNRVTVKARMVAASRVVFNTEVTAVPPVFLNSDAGGFDRTAVALRLPVLGPQPYFDLDNAEANLTVTVTDSDGVAVTESLRVRLSRTPPADIPDVEPTPSATP